MSASDLMLVFLFLLLIIFLIVFEEFETVLNQTLLIFLLFCFVFVSFMMFVVEQLDKMIHLCKRL